jgi:hypothetical protein
MIVKSQKDLFSGLMFTALGVAFAVGAGNYDIGDAARMGPGYFPLVLGVLLAILGAIITFQSFGDTEKPGEKVGALAWKPLVFVIGANLLFGAMLGGIGMIGLPPMGLMISVCVLVVVASMAGDTFKLRESLILAVLLAISSYLIFILGLKLPFQAWPAFITG